MSGLRCKPDYLEFIKSRQCPEHTGKIVRVVEPEHFRRLRKGGPNARLT